MEAAGPRGQIGFFRFLRYGAVLTLVSCIVGFGGLWLERDHGKPAKELLRDPNFVDRYVVDLALGLKACIMLMNPSRIVIGGGISNAGDALFGPLRAELDRQITDWSGARVDVAPAALGNDSVLYGALALAKTLK